MDINKIKEVWNKVYKTNISDLPWENTKIPDSILDKLIRYIPMPYCVLDFGCGTGRLSQYICTTEFLTVDLYDISDIAMNCCRECTKSLNVNYIDNIEQINKKYQGILCWGVFHHLPIDAWSFYFDFFYEHLSDDGVLLFSDFTKRDLLYLNQNRIISEITHYETYAVEISLIDKYFTIIDKGVFEFVENKRKKKRILDYVIARK